METLEENNINEVSPIIIEDFDDLSDEVKQAFLTNITKAYIKKTSDSTIIDQSNYLKDLSFEELRFIPDQGFIGGTVARRLTLNLNNENNQFNLEDEDLKLFIGVEYNSQDYYIDFGNFIVQKPETENTTDNTSIECLDYMCKFNQKYVDQVTYPCTLAQLAVNVCSQAGVSLGNTDFRNADFIVVNNQFVGGESLRTVLGAIAAIAFSWARIDIDNKVYIDFEKKTTTEEELDNEKYFNLTMASKKFGPLNRIILRNSQVEGENAVVENAASIQQYGLHELVISDNPFAYTQEKRTQLIQAASELLGLEYMPVTSMNSVGYVFLRSNSYIKIKDMQGNYFNTYVFNHTINYNGALLDEIASPALTETETKYTYTPETLERLNRTEIIVDKANQTITEVVEKQDEFQQQLVQVETTLDGIEQQVSNITEYKDNISGITEIHLENAAPTQIVELEIQGNKRYETNLYPRSKCISKFCFIS